MYSLSRVFSWIPILILLLSSPSSASSIDCSLILKAADRFRLPEGSARVHLEVSFFKRDKLDKRKVYIAYLGTRRRSLVLFKSAGEQGQKALQLDDRFYLLLPRSRRPVRISPMQKLLGEASVGDISSMTWSEDYTGKALDETGKVDGGADIKLELKSARSGVTYARIELWVSQDDFIPLRANLYLKSGRIAKKVRYISGRLNGQQMITAMVMTDLIQKSLRTEIRYTGIEKWNIPERYFNPAYLTRNNVE